MKKKLLYCFIILSSGILFGCSNSSSNQEKPFKADKTIIVKKSKQVISLYFNGTIMPMETHAVISPMDGTIVKMFFNYGQKLKKGQLLFQLKSSSLNKEYQSAISTYLTAKEKYNTSKSNIIGAQNLFKAGITSKQTYQAAQSSLNDAYLAFLQAENTLIQLLKKAEISEEKIQMLKIGDEAAVKKALEAPIKDIDVNAASSGIALLPTRNTSSSNTGNGTKIQVGSEVKSDQLLVSIGEMSGIKIRVQVGEININQIKKGDKAIITSSGFPGITLKGRVTSVSNQASASNDGGLPTFPVSVSVHNLSQRQQELIHVGMSAKVKIMIATPEEIIIPLKAVKIINNEPYVMLIDQKTGKIKQQQVNTGATSLSGVSILSGLKPGNKIVVSH